MSIESLERRPCAYRTSFALEELDVALADGTRLRLMLKDLSRAALHDEALAAKPELLYEPMREIHVYRDLLDGAGLGTAEYHGSSIDPARDRWWLFIENVVGRRPVADRRVRRLGGGGAVAGAHARPLGVARGARASRCCDTTASCSASGHAVRPASPTIRAVRWSTAERQRIRELAARYDAVTEQLEALAPTFIHGEFYPSNVLVQQGGKTPACVPDRLGDRGSRPGADRSGGAVGGQVDGCRASPPGRRLSRGCRPCRRDRVAPVG